MFELMETTRRHEALHLNADGIWTSTELTVEEDFFQILKLCVIQIFELR
jgi:hypothetical protein